MALELIKSGYDDDSGAESDPNDEVNFHFKAPADTEGKKPKRLVCSAPPVASSNLSDIKPINPETKVLFYNPKYEELYAPEVGPENPFKTNQMKAHRNMLTGFVEECHVNDFQFENQRRTFTSYGYAINPSVTDEDAASGSHIGDIEKGEKSNFKTVYETTKKREGDKRKRLRNDDPSDVDGYLGPWGKYVDEVTVAKPTEEEKKELDEYLSKQNKRSKKIELKPTEEKSILHLKEACDYQGRTFMCEPHDVGVNLKSREPPQKCFLPKKLLYTWTGHNKGVAAVRWFPHTAHLMLTCSMDAKVKLWEVYNNRRCVRTYIGHKEAVRDICFDNHGTKFLSCGYDRFSKLWDTETGQCISRFTNGKVPYCIKFHPEENMQNYFVAGTKDKKIVCWDVRSGEITQEYDRHLGAVNTITFVDQNRRFVSTSDDKSLRVWEWNIPVDFKYIADPSMHSMPAVTPSPNGKWLACQSMDNQIVIFNAINRFKFMRKKVFKGHMVAGYSCGVDFSPEMSYLISGDGDGKLYIWDWKTTKLYTKFQAHDGVCSSCLWHPHETSKVVTTGWDGLIKLWD
ncbi:hypothetical protein HELRODRAFT_94015 [Helobdella robusta]|uniref:Pre-mRNA-processing factor 17 n=1 Tax=Helobdella robusta TaxID=6412 RepID=T1G8Y5_HELRO|nr:hypothetical protein HELRODRAFT_94015 [Helobdella robusta]ESO06288.1 hypothetical protein HELRODRAFT_94015 [Helobdella robusta]